MTPVFFAVRTPGNGPSICLEEPEIRTNLPCAVNPTSANSTCDFPATIDPHYFQLGRSPTSHHHVAAAGKRSHHRCPKEFSNRSLVRIKVCGQVQHYRGRRRYCRR